MHDSCNFTTASPYFRVLEIQLIYSRCCVIHAKSEISKWWLKNRKYLLLGMYYMIAAFFQWLSIFLNSMYSTELISILCNARKIRKFKMAAQKPVILISRHVYMITAFFQRLPPYNQGLTNSCELFSILCNVSKFKMEAEILEIHWKLIITLILGSIYLAYLSASKNYWRVNLLTYLSSDFKTVLPMWGIEFSWFNKIKIKKCPQSSYYF